MKLIKVYFVVLFWYSRYTNCIYMEYGNCKEGDQYQSVLTRMTLWLNHKERKI